MALLPTQTDPPAGSGATFRTQNNANLAQFRTNDQTVEDRLEGVQNALPGTGVIAGTFTDPLFEAGTGLAVDFSALSALIGFVVAKNAASVAVPASSTTYLWLRQDGTYLTTPTSTNPGTANSPALALGTATTDGSGVTGVSVTARIIYPWGTNEETYELLIAMWDADPDTRTGGTVSATLPALSGTPRPGTQVKIFRNGVKIRQDALTYHSDTKETDIADGERPIPGDQVEAWYFE